MTEFGEVLETPAIEGEDADAGGRGAVVCRHFDIVASLVDEKQSSHKVGCLERMREHEFILHLSRMSSPPWL